MFDPSFINENISDYWWDEGFFQSQAQLSKFSQTQWKDLVISWQSQSEEWQDRLAYILGDDNLQHAELLLSMLERGRQSISLRAAESLRSMPFVVVKQAFLVQNQRAVPAKEANSWNSTNALIDHVIRSRAEP